MVDLSSYKKLYIDTTKEYLALLKNQLSVLKQDSSNQNALLEAHRLVHTIKSRSFVMEYTDIAEICKNLEELFYQAKNNTRTISQDTIDMVDQITDKLQEAVDALVQNTTQLDLSLEKSKVLLLLSEKAL